MIKGIIFISKKNQRNHLASKNKNQRNHLSSIKKRKKKETGKGTPGSGSNQIRFQQNLNSKHKNKLEILLPKKKNTLGIQQMIRSKFFDL